MKISIVTSAYKKEKVIGKQLSRLHRYFARRGYDFDIIVVVDGRTDNTEAEIAKVVKQNGYKNIKVFVNRVNKGKGYSLRRGLRHANGDLIMTIDADLDVKLKTVTAALRRMAQGDVDAITPSKYHKDAKVEVNLTRKILSRGFQFGTTLILPTPKGVRDVACALKLYKKEVVKKILPEITVHRFAIDSQMFYLLYKYGFKVGVIPFYASIKGMSTAAQPAQIWMMMRDVIILSIKAKLETLGLYGMPGAYRASLYIDRAVSL